MLINKGLNMHILIMRKVYELSFRAIFIRFHESSTHYFLFYNLLFKRIVFLTLRVSDRKLI